MKKEISGETAAKIEPPKPHLDRLYKPVGIQAITAAAICKGTSVKSRDSWK